LFREGGEGKKKRPGANTAGAGELAAATGSLCLLGKTGEDCKYWRTVMHARST